MFVEMNFPFSSLEHTEDCCISHLIFSHELLFFFFHSLAERAEECYGVDSFSIKYLFFPLSLCGFVFFFLYGQTHACCFTFLIWPIFVEPVQLPNV